MPAQDPVSDRLVALARDLAIIFLCAVVIIAVVYSVMGLDKHD